MKAVILKAFGSADELELKDVADAVAGAGEVLIKTSAISINPVDAKTRKGKGQAARLKNENPMILGWDVAGTVIATGSEVTDFSVGDEIFGAINIPGVGKTYAELVAAKVAHLARKPSNTSFEQAAASGLAAVTAYQALIKHASIKPGNKILIHAAAGGVGHFAVQISKLLQAYVIGTASAENHDFVMGLGADEHIDYRSRPFEEVCQPVDFILDSMGGDNIARSLKVLKEGGTIISLPSGISETVSEQASAQGKNGIHFMVKSDTGDIRQIAQWLEQGKLNAHISRRYRLDQMKTAHEQIESGKSVGKIVVNI